MKEISITGQKREALGKKASKAAFSLWRNDFQCDGELTLQFNLE